MLFCFPLHSFQYLDKTVAGVFEVLQHPSAFLAHALLLGRV
jgi:hypothetical protein